MSQSKDEKAGEADAGAEDVLRPVRYSLPKMLAEVAKDRDSVREGGKLLSQEQIGAVFSSHREKGRND